VKRRFALYLSAAAPVVAAVTVVGTGVSHADISHVAPGPRVVAAADISGRPGTRPAAAGSHRTRPVIHLTCHQTDRPTTGSGPAAGPSSQPPAGASSSAVPAGSTTVTDGVTCHWSHIRRHLKVGSLELLRGTNGSGSPAPAAVQSLAARTRSFTDTTVAPGTAYSYVLHVLGPDGSERGTSNTVKVKVRDEVAPGSDASHETPAASAKAGATEPPQAGGTASPTTGKPTGPTTQAPQHPAGSGVTPAMHHRGNDHHSADPNVSRSRRGPNGQANRD
jgi:hypothetical protein